MAGPPSQPARWSDQIRRLDAETSVSSERAFDRGDRAGFRAFLWRPLQTMWRARDGAPRGSRGRLAMIQGYEALVHAAKLWDLERRWRERDFVTLRHGSRHVLARKEWRAAVVRLLREEAPGEILPGGRGGTRRVSEGPAALVMRSYRRGGAMRWLGSLYFGVRPRPFREFWALATAHRRGLPVPEPLAAVVDRSAGGIAYRGTLITREVSGAVALWDALRAGGKRSSVFGCLGRSLRRIHDQGLWHPDLNLGNVLVVGDTAFVFIDLDRARICSRPLPAHLRRRSLRRLRRSARKLDPEGRTIADGDLALLEEAYWEPLQESFVP